MTKWPAVDFFSNKTRNLRVYSPVFIRNHQLSASIDNNYGLIQRFVFSGHRFIGFNTLAGCWPFKHSDCFLRAFCLLFSVTAQWIPKSALLVSKV